MHFPCNDYKAFKNLNKKSMKEIDVKPNTFYRRITEVEDLNILEDIYYWNLNASIGFNFDALFAG